MIHSFNWESVSHLIPELDASATIPIAFWSGKSERPVVDCPTIVPYAVVLVIRTRSLPVAVILKPALLELSVKPSATPLPIIPPE